MVDRCCKSDDKFIAGFLLPEITSPEPVGTDIRCTLLVAEKHSILPTVQDVPVNKDCEEFDVHLSGYLSHLSVYVKLQF